MQVEKSPFLGYNKHEILLRRPLLLMKRLAWLDIAKYICIMAVMLEHLESTTDILGCFFSPFFVLCFFAVAGYTHRAGQPFGAFAIKKIKTLFVPWLIFSVFDIAVSQLVSFSVHGSFITELGWNFLQIRGHGDQIWFVAALFMAFFSFWMFIEWYSRKPSSPKRRFVFIIIALALFYADNYYSSHMDGALLPWGTPALPWHIEYLFQGMFYMTLGYMFREQWEEKFDKINGAAFCIAVFLVYSIIIYAPYFIPVPEFIFGLFAIYITPLVGIILVFAVSKMIPANRYMCYIGQNTLIYFALHGKIFSFIEGMLSRFAAPIYSAILSSALLTNIFAVVFTALLSLLLIIPAYIINRFFPFVLGRKKKPELRSA